MMTAQELKPCPFCVTVKILERAILDAQLRAFENGRIDTPDEIRAVAIAAMKEQQ